MAMATKVNDVSFINTSNLAIDAISIERSLNKLRGLLIDMKGVNPDYKSIRSEIGYLVDDIELEVDDINESIRHASEYDVIETILDEHAELSEIANAARLFISSRERNLPTETFDYETLRRLCD